MTKTAMSAWAAIIGVVLSTAGCGGKTPDDPGAVDDDGDPSTPPVPTCEAICRAAVDHCFPGAATTQCVSDCESMRTQFKGCPALATFLRCMPTVPVLCTPPSKVEFDGCNDERDQLSLCP